MPCHHTMHHIISHHSPIVIVTGVLVVTLYPLRVSDTTSDFSEMVIVPSVVAPVIVATYTDVDVADTDASDADVVPALNVMALVDMPDTGLEKVKVASRVVWLVGEVVSNAMDTVGYV